MARNYARVGTSIWDDPDFVALPPLAQRCYLFLLSQKDLPLTGVLVRRSKWVRSCEDYKTLDDDLAVLAEHGFVLIDDDTDEVLIRTFMRHDGVLSNEKLRKGARSRVGAIHSPRLRAVVEQQLNESDGVSGALSHDLSDEACDETPDAPEASKPSSSDPEPPLVSELDPPLARMFTEACEKIAQRELRASRARGVPVTHVGKWLATTAANAADEHREKVPDLVAAFNVDDADTLADVLTGKKRLTVADRRAS